MSFDASSSPLSAGRAGFGSQRQPSTLSGGRLRSTTTTSSGSSRLSDLRRRVSIGDAVSGSSSHMDDPRFASGKTERYRGLNEQYERLERATTGRSGVGAGAGRRQRSVKQIQQPALDPPSQTEASRKDQHGLSSSDPELRTPPAVPAFLPLLPQTTVLYSPSQPQPPTFDLAAPLAAYGNDDGSRPAERDPTPFSQPYYQQGIDSAPSFKEPFPVDGFLEPASALDEYEWAGGGVYARPRGQGVPDAWQAAPSPMTWTSDLHRPSTPLAPRQSGHRPVNHAPFFAEQTPHRPSSPARLNLQDPGFGAFGLLSPTVGDAELQGLFARPGPGKEYCDDEAPDLNLWAAGESAVVLDRVEKNWSGWLEEALQAEPTESAWDQAAHRTFSPPTLQQPQPRYSSPPSVDAGKRDFGPRNDPGTALGPSPFSWANVASPVDSWTPGFANSSSISSTALYRLPTVASDSLDLGNERHGDAHDQGIAQAEKIGETPDHQAVPDPCPPPTGSSPRSRFPFPLDLRVHQQHKDEASSASGLRSSSGDPAGVTKIEPAAPNAGPSRPAPRSPHDGSRPRAEARSLSPSRASSASASVSPPPRRPPKRPLKPLRQLSALARRFVDVEAGVAGYASADEEDVDGSSDRSSAVIEEIEDPTESESEGG